MKWFVHGPSAACVCMFATLATSAAIAQETGYPDPGKTIMLLNPFSPGGPTDTAGRMLIPYLEKELGTTVQMVNKPGATTQIATGELVRAKPDGYTVLITNPISASMTYLNPDKGATYTRKDLQPVALYYTEPNLLIVPGNSPYKSVEDVCTAAKEHPREIRMGDVGLLGNTHLAGIAIEAECGEGAEFAFVHFDGAAPLATAMLGGNLDAAVTGVLPTIPHERAGTMRVLAPLGEEESPYFPGVKSAKQQGYNVYSPSLSGFFVPAGTPDDIVETLESAVKAAMENEKFKAEFSKLTATLDFRGVEGLAALWADLEEEMGKRLATARARME